MLGGCGEMLGAGREGGEGGGRRRQMQNIDLGVGSQAVSGCACELCELLPLPAPPTPGTLPAALPATAGLCRPCSPAMQR